MDRKRPEQEYPQHDMAPPRDDKPGISVAEISPDNWQVLRDLKLKSLEQEPIAFEDPEEGRDKYLQRAEAEWREILTGKRSGGKPGQTLTVFAKDEPGGKYIGMVSAVTSARENPEIATVQHMYVDNEGYRGKGIGKQLLQGLIDTVKAKGDIRKLELQVVATQEAAIGLYKSLGFKEIRRVAKAVKRGDQEYDEIEMELELGVLNQAENL